VLHLHRLEHEQPLARADVVARRNGDLEHASIDRRAHVAAAGRVLGGRAQGIAPPAQESPRDILKRRYASGAIEREEYMQKLADL